MLGRWYRFYKIKKIGTVIESQYEKGLKQGFGKIELPCGSIYEGMFKIDLPDGPGKYMTSEYEFTGNFKEGKMNGENCVCVWKNGRKYQGSYVNDKKEGYGQFEWPNGKVYKGGWKSNRMHGKGKIIYPDGLEKEGLWSDGNKVKSENKKAFTVSDEDSD